MHDIRESGGIGDRLSEKGYRMTPQRMMILSVIENSADHISAEEIYAQVADRYPHVNISTVYRTLELLKKLLRLKLGYEISTGDGGPVVAIVVGGTNVGKSTVFNVLVGEKIVEPSEKAGTTKFPVVSLPGGGGKGVLSEDFLPTYEKKELTGDLPETRMDAPGGLQHFFYTSKRGRDLPGLAVFDAPEDLEFGKQLVVPIETHP